MSLSQWAFAASYDVLNVAVEWRIARYRRATAGVATGDVLEIGGGSGANLRYFPGDTRLTFLEPNPHMVRRLRRKAARLGREITVVPGLGEQVPFGDATFDTVLTTLVLCTVIDLDSVVSEARRVLRPGGRFIFYEHVVAASAAGKALQAGLNPAWKFLTTGCHLDRDIVTAVDAAGFAEIEIERFNIRFGTPIALPNVIGTATAAAHPAFLANGPPSD
jgi:SAM-dependent methyltransferase